MIVRLPSSRICLRLECDCVGCSFERLKVESLSDVLVGLLCLAAIEACKQQMVAENLFSGPSDGEVTSKEGPVLEEFIPLKRSEEGSTGRCDGDNHDRPATKKPDWLKSVQLWSQDTNPPASQVCAY